MGSPKVALFDVIAEIVAFALVLNPNPAIKKSRFAREG